MSSLDNESIWWQPELREKLEQGDIVATSLQLQPTHPVRYLESSTGKGGRQNWTECDDPQARNGQNPRVLGYSSGSHVLVLSYGCEIDKLSPAQMVIVAPVAPLSKLPADIQNEVIQQKAFRYMPLMAIPGLGDSYANLGKTFSLQLRYTQSSRLISMTDDGIERLQVQLIGFYTRRIVS